MDPDQQDKVKELLFKKDVESLIDFINKGERNSAWRSSIAIGIINDKKAVLPLIESLKSNNPVVQDYAARALGWLQDERAIEPLKSLASNENRNVRDSAERSVKRILNKEKFNLKLPNPMPITKTEPKENYRSKIDRNKKSLILVGTLGFFILIILILSSISNVSTENQDVIPTNNSSKDVKSPEKVPLSEEQYKKEILPIVDQLRGTCDDLEKTALDIDRNEITVSDATQNYNSMDRMGVKGDQDDLNSIVPPKSYKKYHESLIKSSVDLLESIDLLDHELNSQGSANPEGSLKKVHETRKALQNVSNKLDLGLDCMNFVFPYP